jgi:hypothetical protein
MLSIVLTGIIALLVGIIIGHLATAKELWSEFAKASPSQIMEQRYEARINLLGIDEKGYGGIVSTDCDDWKALQSWKYRIDHDEWEKLRKKFIKDVEEAKLKEEK